METTKAKKVHAEDLHFDHKLWANQLNFYKEELAIFQNRLDEVAKANSTKTVMVAVEQFQNRLTIQQHELTMLLKGIQKGEQLLAANAKENQIAFDHRLFQDHQEERKKIETFGVLYHELKQDLYKSLAEWL